MFLLFSIRGCSDYLLGKDLFIRFTVRVLCVIRPRGYKTFFMLNSTEHEIFPAYK